MSTVLGVVSLLNLSTFIPLLCLGCCCIFICLHFYILTNNDILKVRHLILLVVVLLRYFTHFDWAADMASGM